MKKIQLTKGCVALVDDNDYSVLSAYKWCAHRGRVGESFYAMRALPRTNGRQKHVLMHRVLLGVSDPRIKVDHINHNTLDNRRENLRAVTHAQNLRNRRGAQSNSKLGARGVSSSPGGYTARICVGGGKRLNLGTFGTIAEATAAYAVANRLHFGKHGGMR